MATNEIPLSLPQLHMLVGLRYLEHDRGKGTAANISGSAQVMCARGLQRRKPPLVCVTRAPAPGNGHEARLTEEGRAYVDALPAQAQAVARAVEIGVRRGLGGHRARIPVEVVHDMLEALLGDRWNDLQAVLQEVP